MHITAQQTELAAAAQRVARQLPVNALYPIYSALRLTAQSGTLIIEAFDGDTTAQRVDVNADIHAEGIAFVSSRLLADVLGALGKTDVTLERAEILTVTTPDARFELPLLEGEDWPTPPTPPAFTGTVDGESFAAAIKQVRSAVDPKAAGQFAGMSGIRLRTDGSRLRLTATDRYRIADAWIDWSGAVPEEGMAVFPEQALSSNTGAFTGPVDLALPADGTGTAGLSTASTRIVTTLIDPTAYPHQVDKVIPTHGSGTICSFEAGEMTDAMRRAATVADGKALQLLLSRRGAAISVHATQHGRAHTAVAADWEGDDATSYWNARYVTDGLAPCNGRVEMQFTAPNRPAVLTEPGDDTYRYTVMPIQDVGR